MNLYNREIPAATMPLNVTRSLPVTAAEARALLAGGEAVVRVRMEPQPRPGRYGAPHPTKPNGIIGPLPGCLGGGDYHVWDGPHGIAPLTDEAEYVAVRQCPWYSPETDAFGVVDVLEVPGRRVRLALAITAVGVARAEGAWWWTLNGVAKRKGRVTT